VTAPPPDFSRFDERVAALLGQMTLPEKIGQMCQRHVHEAPTEAQLAAAEQGLIGSFFNVRPEHRNELQRRALSSRLAIPLIFGRDVIHGYRTMFPIPLGLASSFNPKLAEETARVAAREAASQGIDWTFAPMVDVTREPRWGRVAESAGEDPYLAAELGAALVRGFQGPDLSAPESVAACAKHFVGYGASEAGKDYNSTLIPEQSLRELHLPPFKACLDAGVATVMSAFNDLNGVPASGNAFTLRQILRDEWRFSGFVVSDWASLTELMVHGYCEGPRDVARVGASVGVDMEMATTAYADHLQALVAAGELDEAVIDACARGILRVKFACGLFERPLRDIRSHGAAAPGAPGAGARGRGAEHGALEERGNAPAAGARNEARCDRAAGG
jgi:beta-glucosidase